MRDLFGEIVVTQDDIEAWVAALAPAFTSSARAFDNYVRGYHVADKIRCAKAAGTFETTIAAARDRRSRLARRLGVRSW
ncbi:hypothetical protein [Burkholderia perseverans]|uniref:hypothetical protein n=1 Tax=Burkholderia perseverans TaxID=2615214 RepID=UPI001FF05BCC|nr:hypothetical protein [Burkholderia perseverans]